MVMGYSRTCTVLKRTDFTLESLSLLQLLLLPGVGMAVVGFVDVDDGTTGQNPNADGSDQNASILTASVGLTIGVAVSSTFIIMTRTQW
jgi:hypothetical protein